MPKPLRRHQRSIAHRERRFIEEYLRTEGNGAAAARHAGFAAKNAAVQAARMLERPAVKAAIAKRRAAVVAAAQEQTLLTAMDVQLDLKAAHEFDPRLIHRPDGSLKTMTELDLYTARQVEGYEVEETFLGRGRKLLRLRVTKIKFAKRIAVRDQGMKHLGLYKQPDGGGGQEDADALARKVRERVTAIDQSTEGKS